jgi:hypothetical protein
MTKVYMYVNKTQKNEYFVKCVSCRMYYHILKMRNKAMTKQTPLNKQNIIILRWKTDISQLIWELKHSLLANETAEIYCYT